MDSRIRYSSGSSLERKIKEKKLIPYHLYPNDRYKKKQWYFCLYDNIIFKVLEVKYNKDGELDHAYIRTDDNLYSYIASDLTDEDYYIERDTEQIYKENIINSTKTYTGAEIIYWFFIHDITSFDKKYKNFWIYLDRYSTYRISDYSRYYVIADQDKDGNYINCKFIRARLNKNTYTNEQKKEDQEFLKELKEKDEKKVKKIHEKKNNPES